MFKKNTKGIEMNLSLFAPKYLKHLSSLPTKELQHNLQSANQFVN